MSVTNIISERNVSNSGSDLDVFGNEQTIDIINNIVNERVELEERLGDELVQNGDFSELGSDVVVNGDFATDSDWNKGTGWSIINGAAIREGLNSYSNIKQDGILTVGKTYKVTYTVNQGAVNGVRVNIGGVYYGDYYGVGTHTVYGKATNNADLFLMAEPLFQGSIDNVSVKQVDPNDRWTLGDGSGNTKWSITDKANYDHSGSGVVYANRIVQTGLDLKSGKKYKLTFNVTTTGSTAFWIGNDVGTINYEGGTYRTFTTGSQTAIFNMPSDQTTLAFFNNNSDATLDNISLVEVGVDREAFTNETGQHNSTVTNIVNERTV